MSAIFNMATNTQSLQRQKRQTYSLQLGALPLAMRRTHEQDLHDRQELSRQNTSGRDCVPGSYELIICNVG